MVGYGSREGGARMKVTILDDWQDTIRTLARVQEGGGSRRHGLEGPQQGRRRPRRPPEGHRGALPSSASATPIRAPLIERLPKLRMIPTQVGVFPHVDADAATKRGIIISSTPDPGPAVVGHR